MDWKLEVVIVPVADVDRAKHFYGVQLGFVVDHDTLIDENNRIVQLTPPGSGCSIVLTTDNRGMAAGSINGLQLVVPDVETARAQLLQQGVDVGTVKHFEGSRLLEGAGGRWNAFIFFSDPDGNQWVVQERPKD